ncbi:MAG: DNA-binding response regulator [Xenococcaceae cyanobacterium MO_188.B19]|nr:DNA-binding response regulator [Xenococcaceae cyanobacterium MO_188.B19]
MTMTSDIESEILALRDKRLTSKQIARKLGLKVSQVNSVIKASAKEIALARAETGELAPIAQCLVNTNCAERLLTAHPLDEHDVGGLGMVLVARTTGYKRFVVCSYLVDYWCLGLKDTMGEKKLNDIKYQQFLNMVYQGFPDGYQEITLEQAQAIVYGAINYATELGFKPHKDFQKTQNHLGTWNGQPQLTFGYQGKPYFIEGPYDNSTQIMQTLRKNVGEGNFDYLIGLG